MTYYQFLPNYGGIENHIFSISKELQKKRHRMTVITTNLINMRQTAFPLVEDLGGICVIRLKSHVIKASAEIPICPAALFQQLPRFDLLHIHSINPNFFMIPLQIRALIRNIPVIVTPHAHPDRLSAYSPSILYRTYMRRMVPMLLKKANAVIALTPSEKEFYEKWGISRVFEVPNGVDLELHKVNPDKLSCFIQNHDPEKRKILFVGRMIEGKGLQIILKCLPSLLKTHRDIILYAVGAYSGYADYLQTLTKRLGCDKNVRFFFDVPNEDMPYFYEISDLVVMPSRQIEAFCITIIESWAHSKPVLVFNKGGMMDLVSQGGGRAVDSLNSESWKLAINELLSDQQELNQLGNQGLRLVEKKYTLKHVAEKIEHVYSSVQC
jgi:glycogen(starch) synthase